MANLAQLLYQSLLTLPADLQLTPVDGNKRPLGYNWQHHPFTPAQLLEHLQKGIGIPVHQKDGSIYYDRNCQGFGVITGTPLKVAGTTYYLMAVDRDGDSAALKLQELAGGEQITPTVVFTSGRPGRYQMLYLVPAQYCDALQTRKFRTGTDAEGNPEQLELRWKNCQSVLPPSVHPLTGKYTYLELHSFSDRTPAIAPTWLLEAMLKSPAVNDMTDREWALSYLEAISSERADDYENWVQIGMALHSTGHQDLLEVWDKWSQQSPKYKPGECQKKWESFKSSGINLGTLAHLAKADGWKSPRSHSSNVSVPPAANKDASELDVTATIIAVRNILEKGLGYWKEEFELNKLVAQSVMDKQSFCQLVTALRNRLDEVLPEDKARLDQVAQWQQYKFPVSVILPHLADKLIHDADILNVEPVAIWQYLMPAILTFIGSKSNVEVESHKIPAIVWTCLVQESGTGKTRAEKLVLAPLRAQQQVEHTRYKVEYDEYQSTMRNKKKNENSNDEEISPPAPERKYLFEVSTIQALIKRLSEQLDNGSLWARDEIAGLFKSLNQFANNGESEALEILLKLWDGDSAIVDRVKAEDSFVCPPTRLSVAGGIQPNLFRKIFRDPDDSQGMAARYLFACPSAREPKSAHGFCQLSEFLPTLYNWLDRWQPGDIRLEATALQKYREFDVRMQRLAQQSETTAVRTWIRKLPSHLLRIVLSLHCLECYFEPARPKYIIQLSTLNRGIEAAKYYLNSFQLIQEKVADVESVSSQLAKLWDKVNSTPQGLTPRDFYRNNKILQRLAKYAGQKINEYTIELFRQLDSTGKARLEQVGRSIRLYPIRPDNGGGGDDNPGSSPDNPGTGVYVHFSEYSETRRHSSENTSDLGGEVEDTLETEKTNSEDNGDNPPHSENSKDDDYTADDPILSKMAEMIEVAIASNSVEMIVDLRGISGFTPERLELAASKIGEVDRNKYDILMSLLHQATQITDPSPVPKPYTYIDSPEGLVDAVASIDSLNPKLIAIDLETTGLDPLVDTIRLLSLAADSLTTLVFNCSVLDITPLAKFICNSTIKKVAHNAKFEIEFLTKAGLKPEGTWFDTMIASKLIASGKPGTSGTHSLTEVANHYLGYKLDKTWQTWTLGITEHFIAYSALDAEILLPLREMMVAELTSANLVETASIEFSALYAVAEMELTGMCLDVHLISEVATFKAQELALAEAELRATMPGVNNFGSSQQVKAALNAMGVQVESTEEKALKPLVAKFPILAQLLVFKKAKKALEFTEKLPKHIKADGRIHASFNQNGAEATGRFSCSNPNLQQIPRGDRFRECFIPAAGNKLVIADYSQIELRLAAEISGDRTMIEAYQRGEDLHKL